MERMMNFDRNIMANTRLVISTRLVVIVGPSTTGKTTLAKKISSEFKGKSIIISHDDVVNKINKNQPQDKIDMQFRLLLIEQIKDAINDESNKLIILDTLNIGYQSLLAFLCIIKAICYSNEITLFKTDLPFNLHEKYIRERAKKDSKTDLKTILAQRKFYYSNDGSLKASFSNQYHDYLVDDEYIITNPEAITIQFDIVPKIELFKQV